MRQFFIIGHNPNTVADAMNYLRAGANALEPDIHFINGVYYLGEGTTSTDLSLQNYLKGLSMALRSNPTLVPVLIMFDTKNSDGNIPHLLDCVQQNYSAEFKDTGITITRSVAGADEHAFFETGAAMLAPNKAIGIDEHTDPEHADIFFKSLNVTNYTYADGISIYLSLFLDLFRSRIRRAVAMRDKGSSFKMVYSWTLDSASEIQKFLELNPDGLITDNPASLKEILETKFPTQFQLAKLGYNPFK
jgi:hypothetical protein